MSIACIFGVSAAAWWLLYPRLFDPRIRSHVKKQITESSYAKSFGRYEMDLLKEHIRSTSPTGSSSYLRSGVDRVELDEKYLSIFLAGPLGYPIRLAEIGEEACRRAYEFVSSQIARNRA